MTEQTGAPEADVDTLAVPVVELRPALEAILMVSDEPLDQVRLASVVGHPVADVENALRTLAGEYADQGRGFDLRAVAGGWRFYSRPEFAEVVGVDLSIPSLLIARRLLDGATVVAHPRPISPFNWSVYVQTGERIHYTHVNLIRRRAKPEPPPDAGFIERLDASYRPLDDPIWEVRSRFGENDGDRQLARSAWLADELGFFRRFAELPVYDGTTPGSRCVWFFDLRFLAPGRTAVPFRYGACRDGPQARWRVHQIDERGSLVRLIP